MALTHISITCFYTSLSRQSKNLASVVFGSCIGMLWVDANGMLTSLAKSLLVTCFHGTSKEDCNWMCSERVWDDW
jgi:chemotaxis receptor (MCP) glutamine deamidase CheD